MDQIIIDSLDSFFVESDEIENIRNINGVSDQTLFFVEVLDQNVLSIDSILKYLNIVQPDAVMREKVGMNVYIGSIGGIVYTPPPGGPIIKDILNNLIIDINNNEQHPYALHKAFENLHPFTDGNGRTGRFIWLWQMWKYYEYRAELRFLEMWYRQSLD